MTSVRLLGIEGLQLTVAGHDLLDATPVLDIKPYVPYADAFPEAATGWLEDREQRRYAVAFDAGATERSAWILQQAGLDCDNFACVQLMQDPTDAERKRITPGSTADVLTIAYRTWRLDYTVSDEDLAVRVTGIRSGYDIADLDEGSPDRHGDKAVHRRFRQHFQD
jgi:hypothetical protein